MADYEYKINIGRKFLATACMVSKGKQKGNKKEKRDE
jgi:hypothetical protein